MFYYLWVHNKFAVGLNELGFWEAVEPDYELLAKVLDLLFPVVTKPSDPNALLTAVTAASEWLSVPFKEGEKKFDPHFKEDEVY